MKIGCDIDGVVLEFVPAYLEIFEKRYGRKVLEENIFSFDLWKPLKISKKEAIDITKELFTSKKYPDLKFVEGAKRALLELSKGNEFNFLTARPDYAKDATQNTFDKNFLNQDFPIYYTGDFFNGTLKKSDLCVNLDIKLMIEDNLKTAMECSDAGIDVFLFDRPWNKDFEELTCKNIKRVYNWNEVLKEVKNASRN